MTFNISTSAGTISIKTPFRLNRRSQAKIKKVFAEISSPHEPLPDETMKAFLERTTPGIQTAIGKIKGLLALYGWNQKALSQKSGLSVSIICDILKSRRSIGVVTAKKLGKTLEVDYRQFL